MTIERQPETVQYKCLYNISIMKPKKRGHETNFKLVVHKIINLLILSDEIFVRKELQNA